MFKDLENKIITEGVLLAEEVKLIEMMVLPEPLIEDADTDLEGLSYGINEEVDIITEDVEEDELFEIIVETGNVELMKKINESNDFATEVLYEKYEAYDVSDNKEYASFTDETLDQYEEDDDELEDDDEAFCETTYVFSSGGITEAVSVPLMVRDHDPEDYIDSPGNSMSKKPTVTTDDIGTKYTATIDGDKYTELDDPDVDEDLTGKPNARLLNELD